MLTPANTRRPPKAGSMLAHRLRCWPNIEPIIGERLVRAGTIVLLNCELVFLIHLKLNSLTSISTLKFILIQFILIFINKYSCKLFCRTTN